MGYGIIKTPDEKYFFGLLGKPNGLAISIKQGWRLFRLYEKFVTIDGKNKINMTTQFKTAWLYDDFDIPRDAQEQLSRFEYPLYFDGIDTSTLENQFEVAQVGDLAFLSNGLIPTAKIIEKTDKDISVENYRNATRWVEETVWGMRRKTAIPYLEKVSEIFSIETGENVNKTSPLARAITKVNFALDHPWFLQNITTGNGQ